MAYGLVIQTAPSIEPVTLGEAKKQVEMAPSYSAHDNQLTSLIIAARQYVEQHTGRALINQTWDLYFDDLPGASDPIYLPKAPLSSVTHVKYYDADGVQQTWGSSNYIVSTSREPGCIRLAPSATWPTYQDRADSLVIRYVAGYGSTAASVPEALRNAILLLVGSWFEQREASTDRQHYTLPHAIDALLTMYRVGDEFTCYTPLQVAS